MNITYLPPGSEASDTDAVNATLTSWLSRDLNSREGHVLVAPKDLDRLALTVNRFIADYAFKASRNPYREVTVYNTLLGWAHGSLCPKKRWPRADAEKKTCISHEERIRFQPAFLRYELYSPVFSHRLEAGSVRLINPLWEPQPVQSEDVICVYWYMFTLHRVVFASVYDERRPPTHRKPTPVEPRNDELLIDKLWATWAPSSQTRDTVIRIQCSFGLDRTSDLLTAFPEGHNSITCMWSQFEAMEHERQAKKPLPAASRFMLTIMDLNPVSQGWSEPGCDVWTAGTPYHLPQRQLRQLGSLTPNRAWRNWRQGFLGLFEVCNNGATMLESRRASAWVFWSNRALSSVYMGTPKAFRRVGRRGWHISDRHIRDSDERDIEYELDAGRGSRCRMVDEGDSW